MTEHPLSGKRRRLDTISAPEFISGLDNVDDADLRERRRVCAEVEHELSYHRRLLHGRLDLVAFEQRRRRGDEQGDLVEGLPDVLNGVRVGPGRPSATSSSVTPPESPTPGRRRIDMLLDDAFVAGLPDMSDEELGDLTNRLSAAERDVSAQRALVHVVEGRLTAELVRRYRSGTLSADDLLDS